MLTTTNTFLLGCLCFLSQIFVCLVCSSQTPPRGATTVKKTQRISAFVMLMFVNVHCCRCLLMLLLPHLRVILLSHLLVFMLPHLPRSNPLSLGRPSLSLLAERMEASLSLSLSLSLSASISLMASLALLAEFMWAGPADLPPVCTYNDGSTNPSNNSKSVCTLATAAILLWCLVYRAGHHAAPTPVWDNPFPIPKGAILFSCKNTGQSKARIADLQVDATVGI